MSLPARIYTVTFENVSIAASQDFFEITPADDKPVMVLGWEIDNVGGTADAGDAQEEFWRLLLRRGHTVSGSGGTAPTPTPVVSTDAASGFTAEVNNTTIANTGTTKDVWTGGLNVRIPGPLFLIPEVMPIVSQADTTLVLRLLSTPADAVLCSGTLWVAELG
jgi:hypothetical protein